MLLLHSILALFTTSFALQQPWPVKVDHIGFCCSSLIFNLTYISKLLANSESLSSCLNRFDEVGDKNKPVLLVTNAEEGSGDHAIHDINVFSPFGEAALRAYAEHNGFGFYKPKTFKFPAEKDPRWHKIRILSGLAESYEDSSVQYFLWIDADAIVLDFNFSPTKLMSVYPAADLIASSDIRMGLINSGVMIIRNTPWSRAFLQQWWDIADRNIVCDQDAFDMLYQQLVRNNTHHKIKILPMDTINSHPPAWAQQHPNNQILHLMGEISLFRGLVFQEAFRHICQTRSGGFLPPQLGVHREMLLDLAQVVYRNETQVMFNTANRTGAQEDIDKLIKSAYHYTDILQHLSATSNDVKKKSLYMNEVVSIRQGVMNLILLQLDLHKQQLDQINLQLNQTLVSLENEEDVDSVSITSSSRLLLSSLQIQRQEELQQIVTLLKQACESGNALFWSIHRLEDRRQVALLVFELLEELTELVVESSKSTPQHMTALMYQNLAISIYEQAMKLDKSDIDYGKKTLLQEAQLMLQESVRVFELYVHNTADVSIQREYVQSLQLLSGITCLLGDYSRGTELWQTTISKAKDNLHGVKTGVQYEKYALILYNAGVCMFDKGDLEAARSTIQQSMTVLEDIVRNNHDDNLGHVSAGRSGISVKGHDEITDISAFLKTVRAFHQQIEDQIHIKQPFVTKSSHTIEATRVMRAISLPDGSVKYVVDDGSNVQKEVDVEEEEEWEECPDYVTEGCETFDVVPSPLPSLASLESASSTSSFALFADTYNKTKHPSINDNSPQSAAGTIALHSNSSDYYQVTGPTLHEDLYLYEDIDEEEKAELIFTRQRHAINTKEAREALELQLRIQQGLHIKTDLAPNPSSSASTLELFASDCSRGEYENLHRKFRKYQEEYNNLRRKVVELEDKLNAIARVLGESEVQSMSSALFENKSNHHSMCSILNDKLKQIKEACEKERERVWALEDHLETHVRILRGSKHD